MIATTEIALHDEREKVARLNKVLLEEKKELIIAKEEARRAWEELGRREEEERECVLATQQGTSVSIGDIRLVPTSSLQGNPSSRGLIFEAVLVPVVPEGWQVT